MVWNKTKQEIVDKIIVDLYDVQNTYAYLAGKYNVSEWLIGDFARNKIPEEIRKLRYSYSCAQGKLGSKNPMFGKKAELHHNHTKEVQRVAGYKTVFKPDWWIGSGDNDSRMYEHHYIWGSFYKQSAIPKGCVIHHIDLDKDNNSIENLQLLTRAEHMTLHAEIRKVQRLSREGVGFK